MERMLDPIPVIRAPMETSMRHRSWMCGSEAAFSIVVSPSASTAAMRAFSVAVTEASSRKIRAPFSLLASSVKEVPTSTRVPSSVRARKCVSSGRRPIPSPPGRRQDDPSLARQERSGEQDGGADLLGEVRRDLLPGNVQALEAPPVMSELFRRTAQGLEDLDHDVHVFDLRQVREDHGLVSEKRRGEAGKRGVLVPARLDTALEGEAALDFVMAHSAIIAIFEYLRSEHAPSQDA